MVDDVEISDNGRVIEKKVIYLSNKQCNMFDDVGIERCIQALDMGRPKCVIRLMAADHGVAAYTVHTEKRGYVLSWQQFGPELNYVDSNQSQIQLDLFMKTCVLPLAKQTHALIICSGCNDDMLAQALERVVLPEQSRMGKNCPFKVLTFVWAFEVHYKAFRGEGIAGQVASECGAWAVRLKPLTEFMQDWAESRLQRADMIMSASHVIVFEAMEPDGTVKMGPAKAFQSKLTDSMTDKLPSIVIQTSSVDYTTLADLGRRGIPILFLDMRERAITSKINASGNARPLLTHLAKATNAFPVITADQLAKFPKNPDGTMTITARRSLLNLAYDMIEGQIACLALKEIVDYDVASAISLVHAALHFGEVSSDSDGSYVPLYARINECKRAEQSSGANAGGSSSSVPLELAKEAAHFINSRLRMCIVKAKLIQVNKWLQNNPPGSKLDHNRVLGTSFLLKKKKKKKKKFLHAILVLIVMFCSIC
jgi:hypothetical protein